MRLASPLLNRRSAAVPLADLAGWLQMPESKASGLLKALVRAGGSPVRSKRLSGCRPSEARSEQGH